MSTRRGPPRVFTRRCVVGAALASPWIVSAARAERAVTFGLTPVFLSSDLQLIGQLEGFLSDQLRRRVVLVKRRTYQEITSLLVAGQIDAAWICGYPFVQSRNALRLLAVPVYRGEPLYRSYIITGHDRPAASVRELAGDIHAYSDPDSNSGFLVTQAMLAGLTADPSSFFRRTFFTYGHRNVIRAVAAGLAHSGSVDGYVWDVVQEIEPKLTNRTRIVWQSEPMGFPPVAASTQTDPGTAAAISEALIGMAGTPKGRIILSTLRLDGFTNGRTDLFASIEAMTRRVRLIE